jgi:hypothetical protein
MKRHDHTPSGSSDKLSPAERREMRLLKPNKHGERKPFVYRRPAERLADRFASLARHRQHVARELRLIEWLEPPGMEEALAEAAMRGTDEIDFDDDH